MMQTFWLWHPDSPGQRVLVVRGFWARLFNPKDFATLDETMRYALFMAGLKRSRFSDE